MMEVIFLLYGFGARRQPLFPVYNVILFFQVLYKCPIYLLGFRTDQCQIRRTIRANDHRRYWNR